MTLLNKKKKNNNHNYFREEQRCCFSKHSNKKKKLERDRRAEKVMPPSETFGCTGLSNVLQHTWLREVPDEKN